MQAVQNTPFLGALLVTAIAGSYITSKTGHNVGFNTITQLESGMGSGLIFTAIVLAQAILGAKGLTNTPAVVNRAFKNPSVRFVALFLIALVSTKNVESSAFITLAFVTLMQLLRTPEERKKTPYLI
jgi:uncharacterized membrane protein YtjA (UPF0391 family)